MKSLGQRLLVGTSLLAVLATAGSARAATATWTGAVNNNWNNSGNWSWSPACAACLPGTGGGASADVVIGAGAGTVTINAALGSLSLATLANSGGNVNGSATTVSTTGAITISGSGSLSPGTGAFTCGGAFNVSGNGSFTGGSGSLSISGDLVLSNNGAFTGPSSTTPTTIGGNVTYGSSGDLNFRNGSSTTVTVTGFFQQSAGNVTTPGTALTIGTVMVPQSLTVSGGSFNGGGGTITVTGDLALSGSGAFQSSSVSAIVGGNLSLGGSSSYARNGSGTLQVGGSISESGGTFTGGPGLIQIGGDLGPLSGGAFTAGSGTMRIGGRFNRTSASNAFDGNGGTIVLVATSAKSHTFSGAAVGSVIINDGLVGYWALDEGTASHPDSGGYGNDGTLSGSYNAAATLPSLAFADTAAMAFNGSSNYMTLGTTALPAANAAQTISAWVNFSAAAATQTIVAMTASGSAIKLGLGGGNVRALRNDATVLVQAAAPSAGAWHHVAYVYDPALSGANKDKLYIDGTAATGTSAAHDGATPTAAFMGASSAGVDLLNGSLDEVRVYSRALAAREMNDLAFGRTPASGAVTHTFSDALDTSNAGNNGHFVIASGIVAGSSAFNVSGSWLNYGGRFAGTGLVTLSSGGSRFLQSGGDRFPTLTIDSNGKYTLLDRLWVSGTLNITGQSASFNDGGYVFHAGAFATTSTSAYQVTGGGTAVFDGRSSQTITAQNFNGLRIEAPNETGLVAYWKLDEGQGTAVRDVSANGNDGTLSASGASWASASGTIAFDNAAAGSFNGTSGYISAGATSLPAAGAAQTISTWVKFGSAAATQTLVAMTASGSAIKLGLGGSNVRVLRNDGTVLAQASAPSTGTWHHLAYVYDPTASGVNRDKIYVDGTATTGTNTSHDVASPTAAFLGASSAAADFFNGQLDDVRVYSQALTAAQVTSLKLGRYAGTGVSTTVTVGHNVSMASSGTGVFIDSGVLYSSTFTVTVSVTGTPCRVDSGTLHIGSAIVNCDGGLTINPMGTLLMDEASGQFQPGVNSTVTIDGTLTGSNTGAIIQRDNGGERYTFKVGSFSGATPALNITGLAVRDTDANGMQINANTGAVTTFTHFDNITFRRGTGTYLKIYATSLYLNSSGCVFGVGDGAGALPTNNVTLTGNGTADGETRVMFGTATCHANKTTAGYCQDAWASDDDADNNGVGDTPATNGAVVQYVRSISTDIAGNIEGLPTAAFDWNTFTYYSTYAAFHDASGTADRIYVRDQTGTAKYSWDTPSGETIVGTPRWNTTSGSHYLYVALASGKVYRLIDNGASLVPDTSVNWAGANNPFNCACTIVSPLAMDTSNLYWGGTRAGPTQMVWTLGQASRSQPTGSPLTITPVITTSSPGLWVNGATTYLFMGLVGNIIKLNVTTQVIDSTNTNPGTAAIRGRVVPSVLLKVYAGDDGGTMWALDAGTNFGGTNKLWSYVVAGDSIQSSPYVDSSTTAGVYFGTDGGKVIGLNMNTGAALTGYPYVPGTTSDKIRTAPLYTGGLLIVGTTTGKLFFLDRNNGTTGPALVRQYYFGPTEAVSAVAYDTTVSRYMVSTSDSNTNDGRLYYIDLVADPTAGTP